MGRRRRARPETEETPMINARDWQRLFVWACALGAIAAGLAACSMTYRMDGEVNAVENRARSKLRCTDCDRPVSPCQRAGTGLCPLPEPPEPVHVPRFIPPYRPEYDRLGERG